MTGVLRLLALNGIALIGFCALVAAAAALAHRTVASWARGLTPSARSRILLGWAAAPVAIATTLLFVALWPSIGAAIGLAVDHCPAHAGHVHLCLHHLPASGPDLIGSFALATLGIVAAAVIARGIGSGTRGAAIVRARSSVLPSGVGVIESSRPFAMTVGWFRPSVLVSTALLDRLATSQLQIVVAHERAHAERRDALTVTAARVLALAHLPRVRRQILAELTLACEQACDEVAAGACGDRVLVAETIVAAERAAGSVHGLAVPGLAFDGGQVESRVESLLAPPLESRRAPRLRWIVLAVGAALAFAAPHVHHWTETFLDRLPH